MRRFRSASALAWMRRSSVAISSTPFSRSASSSAGSACSRRSSSASWARGGRARLAGRLEAAADLLAAAGEVLGEGRPQQVDEAADEDGKIEEAGEERPRCSRTVGGLGPWAAPSAPCAPAGRRPVRRGLAVGGLAGAGRRGRGVLAAREPAAGAACGAAGPAPPRAAACSRRAGSAGRLGGVPGLAIAPAAPALRTAWRRCAGAAWTAPRRGGARLGVLDGDAAQRDQGRKYGRGAMPRPLEESFTKSEGGRRHGVRHQGPARTPDVRGRDRRSPG